MSNITTDRNHSGEMKNRKSRNIFRMKMSKISNVRILSEEEPIADEPLYFDHALSCVLKSQFSKFEFQLT